MIVIGISGKAMSGKDTACQAIIEANPDIKIERIAFGDALKIDFFYRLLDDKDELWKEIEHPGLPENTDGKALPALDYINKHKPVFRFGLQYLGTEFMRKRDPFYWIKKVREEIQGSTAQCIIIPDLRFVNEYYFLKDYHSFTIRTSRSDGVTTEQSGHSSETDLDNYGFDYTIVAAGGDVEAVKLQAMDIFEDIKIKVVPQVPSQEELTL